MKISEKQLISLIECARKYIKIKEQEIKNQETRLLTLEIANDRMELMLLQNLLSRIYEQQSEELKDVE